MSIVPRYNSCWYIVTSRPRQDAYAEEHLIRQGFPVYRPLVEREVRRSSGVVKLTESLFPGYMFVALDLSTASFGAISSTYGVSGFVELDGGPEKVSDELVNGLKLREQRFSERGDLGGFNKDGVTGESALQGIGAIFEKSNGQGRVVLLMRLIVGQPNAELSPEVYKSA